MGPHTVCVQTIHMLLVWAPLEGWTCCVGHSLGAKSRMDHHGWAASACCTVNMLPGEPTAQRNTPLQHASLCWGLAAGLITSTHQRACTFWLCLSLHLQLFCSDHSAQLSMTHIYLVHSLCDGYWSYPLPSWVPPAPTLDSEAPRLWWGPCQGYWWHEWSAGKPCEPMALDKSSQNALGIGSHPSCTRAQFWIAFTTDMVIVHP